MTTFDGSSGAPRYAYDAPVQGGVHSAPPPVGPDAAGDGASSGFDAFEALREQLAERDSEFGNTTYVEVPGIGWRLVCRIDFEYGHYKDWQKTALPKNQRNGRKLNPLDMNQAVLAHLVLVNTCESIEYQHSGGWDALTDADGEPATLHSPMLLERMGVMDPRLLTRRLFGGDGRLIAAGQRVISEAGYGEPDDGDAEDPTD